MVDDFWGEAEWSNFYSEIKRVFPDREPQDVPLSHDIFHCVYDLKERPQVSTIGVAAEGYSYERFDARDVHYRAIFDDDGRMVVVHLPQHRPGGRLGTGRGGRVVFP